MIFEEDNTYSEIRERSIMQWIDEMSRHEDVAVRGGVKVTLDYIIYLKKEIERLKDKNNLKDEYLKKMKSEILKRRLDLEMK